MCVFGVIFALVYKSSALPQAEAMSFFSASSLEFTGSDMLTEWPGTVPTRLLSAEGSLRAEDSNPPPSLSSRSWSVFPPGKRWKQAQVKGAQKVERLGKLMFWRNLLIQTPQRIIFHTSLVLTPLRIVWNKESQPWLHVRFTWGYIYIYVFFQNINVKTPCPDMLTHLGMGLWNEYFWKTPPGDSNMCPLSTLVVESWPSNSRPHSRDSARRRQASVRRNLGEWEHVCLENARALYMHCMDIFIDM